MSNVTLVSYTITGSAAWYDVCSVVGVTESCVVSVMGSIVGSSCVSVVCWEMVCIGTGGGDSGLTCVWIFWETLIKLYTRKMV